MAGARRIVIEFLGRDRSLGSTAADVDRKTSKLGGKLAMVGKVAAVGFAGGVAVAGKALYDMAGAAIEDQASQARLAKTLQNTTGATSKQVAAVEDWITAQGKALGVTDDQLRPAMENLVRATGDVSKAQKLASLAMDISAGTGKDLGAVSMALAKAQNGQVAGLARLGIKTKDAAGETKSFAQLQDELAKKFAGQASTAANTYQGKMARLKLMFDEAKESVGAKLLPVLARMGEWFMSTGLPAIQRFGGWLSATFGPIFERIGSVVKQVMGTMRGDFGKSFADIKAIFTSATSIISSLWNTFGGTLMTYAKRAFGAIRQIISGAFTAIRGLFQFWSNVLKGNWSGAWEALKTILRGAWTALGGIVRLGWAAIRAIFGVAITALKGVFRGAWDGLKTIAENGWRNVQDFIAGIPGKIRNLGGAMRDAGGHLIGKFLDGLRNMGGIIGDLAGDIWGAIKDKLNSAIDAINEAIPNKIGPINLPNNPFPHFANGGTMQRTGLAVVGEEGPELVHLPGGARVYSNKDSVGMARGLDSGGGTQTYVIDLRLDGKTIQTLLLKEKRRKGVGLGLA